MARQVKKGITFFPTVDTEFDKMGDASSFAVEMINAASGAVEANAATGTYAEVMWTDPSHSGTVAGAVVIDDSVITLGAGHDFVAGDRFDDGAGNLYYITSVNGNDISIKGKLVANIADAASLASVGNTGIYKVDCQIANEGEFLVNVSHPEFGHSTVKYEIITNDVDDVYTRLDEGLNSLGANATMKVIA